MSSLEESTAPTVKKRKIQRACDYCRSKKIKCDGSDMPNNRCSKCTARRIDCTYLLGQNNSYPRSYVEDLESRLERMEKLMNKFLPDKDVAKELDDHGSDGDPINAPTPASERSHASGSRVDTLPTPSALVVTPVTPDSPANAQQDPQSEEEEGDDGELDKELAEEMRKLSMHSPPLRYHGKSSGLVFIRSAMAMKNAYAGFVPPPGQRDGQHPWLKTFVENDFPMLAESSFPPCDLLDILVDLYFAHTNSQIHLLHEPTFRKAIEAGEHLRNGGFGATVLLTCAIGARFTRDPRVLLDDSEHYHSAGWGWFLVVVGVRKMSFAPAKLYDLQIHALMAAFLQGTTAPQSTWLVIGAGIRMALDVGVHRKKMYSPTPTVEEELWRRAFWFLVLIEWTISYGLGRPSCIHDEDLDLALPTECDDEYWLTPEGEPLFKQPQGKPSTVTTFVCMIRLGQILAFAMRTVYSTNKSRAQLGQSDQQWEQRIVADLDSALNKWADSLPSHLRWDPEEQNEVFLAQAATVRVYYHYTQIAVHRSFISPARRESPLSFPSVIICTNGARSSIQVLEVVYKRTGTPGYRNFGILFMSGIILMTNIFALKRAGRMVNAGKDLVLVRKAIEMLRLLRYEIHVAESLGEMLNELVTAIKDPLSPEAGVPTPPQEPSAPSAGTGRPPSPAALERPAHDHTEGPDANLQSTPGDGNNIDTGTRIHIPPTLDFLQPDVLPFVPPVDVGLGSFAGSSAYTGGASQASQPPSVLPHEFSFLPLGDPLAPQPASSSLAGTSQGVHGQDQFGVGAASAQMFCLEPLGYNESMSMSFLPSVSEPQARTSDYAQPHHTLAGATGPGLGVEHMDAGMPDFALMDDALMLWSDLPPTVGWEEWGALFSDTNNVGT